MLRHQTVQKRWNENLSGCERHTGVVLVFLHVAFFFALDQERNCANSSQLCDDDDIFVFRFNCLVHENSICIQTIWAGWVAPAFVALTQNNNSFGFHDFSSFQVFEIQCRTSDQVDVLKSINLAPDIGVTVDIFVSKIIIRQNDDRTFDTILESGPQWKNQVFDSFNNSTDNDMTLYMFVQLIVIQISIVFQAFGLWSCVEVLELNLVGRFFFEVEQFG